MRSECPWNEAERRFGLEVLQLPLPPETGGAVLRRKDGHAWIIIDPTLSPVEQRCRLAHELVHLDRGSSLRCRWSPRSMDTIIMREELRVDSEVSRWLVDQDELWILVGDMVASGDDVTARVIAEHFQVTKPIARIALDRLARVQGVQVA